MDVGRTADGTGVPAASSSGVSMGAICCLQVTNHLHAVQEGMQPLHSVAEPLYLEQKTQLDRMVAHTTANAALLEAL